MKKISNKVYCGRRGNVGANFQAYSVVARCLVLSDCTLFDYELCGNESWATMSFTVQGTAEQIRLFNAAFGGATQVAT